MLDPTTLTCFNPLVSLVLGWLVAKIQPRPDTSSHRCHLLQGTSSMRMMMPFSIIFSMTTQKLSPNGKKKKILHIHRYLEYHYLFRYIPVLPMVLVNGADGIGTGWMTKVPNYNPREIVRNLRKMLKGEEPKPMVPWFKNFRGSIEPLDHQRYVVNGEIASLSDTKVEITELPVKTWTNAYKEMLEGMLTVSIIKTFQIV